MATSNQTTSQTSSTTKTSKSKGYARGSGSDKNSDTRRLHSEENLLDKTNEDSFPASDPPSHTPISGVTRARPLGEVPRDLKESGKAQFQYGRRVEAKTLHFEPNTNRLDKGNPDIGDVDLGNIEADQPSQRDDDDLYD
jgi:hypothetical protein